MKNKIFFKRTDLWMNHPARIHATNPGIAQLLCVAPPIPYVACSLDETRPDLILHPDQTAALSAVKY
ncbi:hypothetical protein QO004_005965 [Rhizobium mesoamericanum]|nr:hypothetical protein [Rhizobium mesoamericanum]